MGHPAEIADAVARDSDRFGLVLAAAEHAREIGNTILKWNAPPIGSRCAAALHDVACDADLRKAAWARLIEHRRVSSQADEAPECDQLNEDRLLRLLAGELPPTDQSGAQ
ncbi:MAG: hypothetical protein AAFU49_10470 [Pseudomonadota bacterium]